MPSCADRDNLGPRPALAPLPDVCPGHGCPATRRLATVLSLVKRLAGQKAACRGHGETKHACPVLHRQRKSAGSRKRRRHCCRRRQGSRHPPATIILSAGVNAGLDSLRRLTVPGPPITAMRQPISSRGWLPHVSTGRSAPAIRVRSP